ncbi:molybdate ABC transporter substrate-binding protein [Mucilaginibacter sp. UR6-1]|uniref:molybdate ABC transporter substrate-binding protein n=1 Tax=Mucilaginibacter sp. UR6-1 TaxID=1435643 RepID=UPI001E400628|nr:molybdate ABC transporter substrate-binding protein [Mucilaginibacter sp. UR6-1]MCC8411054.1 molybdate ABC transporter substrate-binding protein [Mucilaginibacter sp. UR6-1]
MKVNKTGWLLTLLLGISLSALAQDVKVAAAANLQSVIKPLAAEFKKQTGISITPITGASGKLTAQAMNGAPFDIFLSADVAFAETLYAKGFAINKPVVYARGSLILCSQKPINLNNWKALLNNPSTQKIAIANPATAPYGKAATEVLQHENLLTRLKTKLVYGESISQVNTYITTGIVQAGFTTEALIKDPQLKTMPYWVAMDDKLYAPVKQAMVLLKGGKHQPSAIKFYNFLLSNAAKRIFKQYGYKTL